MTKKSDNNQNQLELNPSSTAESVESMGDQKAVKSILRKVFEIKHQVGAISKDSKNPYFNSKYFDINQLLEHIEPMLFEHKLICLQPIIDNKVVTQIIDIESGSSLESSIALPESLTDPQKLGSAITYFRRYTLASLLSLQAEDDDGNRASKKRTETQSKSQTTTNTTTASTPAQTPLMTAEQFKLAMESDAKGVEATIKAIDNGKIKANVNQKNKLKVQLEKLKK